MDEPPPDPKSQPPFLPPEGQPQQGTPREGSAQPAFTSQPNWEQPPGPQPQYAQYYRPTAGQPNYGSWQQLQALADGYFGLSWAFLVNVICAVGINIGFQSMSINGRVTSETSWALIYLGLVLCLGIVIALMTYPPNKKIAFGKGWKPGSAVLASVLMALNSIVCCGIIGYAVMQQLALSEMKLYGVRPRGFGLRRKDIDPIIQALKNQEHQGQVAPVYTPPS